MEELLPKVITDGARKVGVLEVGEMTNCLMSLNKHQRIMVSILVHPDSVHTICHKLENESDEN